MTLLSEFPKEIQCLIQRATKEVPSGFRVFIDGNQCVILTHRKVDVIKLELDTVLGCGVVPCLELIVAAAKEYETSAINFKKDLTNATNHI